jgi:hypothetical protein
MAQKSSRVDRLFGRSPTDIPEWMAIRDADAKRRSDIQAKLKAARLARDGGQPVKSEAAGPAKRRAKGKSRPAPNAAG